MLCCPGPCNQGFRDRGEGALGPNQQWLAIVSMQRIEKGRKVIRGRLMLQPQPLAPATGVVGHEQMATGTFVLLHDQRRQALALGSRIQIIPHQAFQPLPVLIDDFSGLSGCRRMFPSASARSTVRSEAPPEISWSFLGSQQIGAPLASSGLTKPASGSWKVMPMVALSQYDKNCI